MWTPSCRPIITWTSYHQNRGRLGVQDFSIHSKMATCLLRSPDHGFNLLILFCQPPTKNGKFLRHSVQLVTKVAFFLPEVENDLGVCSRSRYGLMFFKTCWNSKLFLRVFSHVFFSPFVMWCSPTRLKSSTNFSRFWGVWKLHATINRKYPPPGDELATCLHSIGWRYLSPASASDIPVSVLKKPSTKMEGHTYLGKMKIILIIFKNANVLVGDMLVSWRVASTV